MKPVPETNEVLDALAGMGGAEMRVTLIEMGDAAKDVVPQCVGLSLASIVDGLTFTLVATSDEIAALDAVQYLDGGPCVFSAHENEIVGMDHDEMITEHKWLLYAQASAAAGVASSLTLPILNKDRVIGTVNLYAATSDAFEGREDDLAQAVGASAASAVRNADLGFETRLEAARAPERLVDQNDVDIALGIIAGSQRVDIPTAQERLRQAAARADITEAQAARAARGILRA